MFAGAIRGFAGGAEHLKGGGIDSVYLRKVKRRPLSSIEEVAKRVAKFFGCADFKSTGDAHHLSGLVFSDVHGAPAVQ